MPGARSAPAATSKAWPKGWAIRRMIFPRALGVIFRRTGSRDRSNFQTGPPVPGTHAAAGDSAESRAPDNAAGGSLIHFAGMWAKIKAPRIAHPRAPLGLSGRCGARCVVWHHCVRPAIGCMYRDPRFGWLKGWLSKRPSSESPVNKHFLHRWVSSTIRTFSEAAQRRRR